MHIHVLAMRSDDSLNAEGQIRYKPCLVTTDTRASVTIIQPDITTGMPKRPLLS
jgi:hypothetical protein